MPQLLEPDDYASLNLPDQFIEDFMQQHEADLLLKRLDGCHTVLDLGYGSGIICRALADAGKAVTVVEGSRAGYEAAMAINGCNAVLSLFEDYVAPQRFDAVIASFVLEHVADPVALLRRCRTWGKRLICVVGNANSYHRQLAVQMGLQPRLDSLSERDKLVGHYKVYDLKSIYRELLNAEWRPLRFDGLMFKSLPNSMLINLPKETIKGMCEMEIDPDVAANIMVTCGESL